MRRAYGAVVALAAATAWLACGPPASGRSAEELWRENCVRCHGADGTGVAAMRSLDPGVDLRRSVLIQKRARGLLYQRIAWGYGAMPGFSHRLPRGDVELLVRYVLDQQGR